MHLPCCVGPTLTACCTGASRNRGGNMRCRWARRFEAVQAAHARGLRAGDVPVAAPGCGPSRGVWLPGWWGTWAIHVPTGVRCRLLSNGEPNLAGAGDGALLESVWLRRPILNLLHCCLAWTNDSSCPLMAYASVGTTGQLCRWDAARCMAGGLPELGDVFQRGRAVRLRFCARGATDGCSGAVSRHVQRLPGTGAPAMPSHLGAMSADTASYA